MISRTFTTTIVRDGSMCFIPFDPKSVFGNPCDAEPQAAAVRLKRSFSRTTHTLTDLTDCAETGFAFGRQESTSAR
jgi:hypothetical protein